MTGNKAIHFNHQQTAHCESGVTASLLTHHGLEISEPLAFGIGAGLYFIHLPFIKIDRVPLTSYRIMPGAIFKRVTRQLGVNIREQRFRDQQEAMQQLDQLLAQGIPVGLQVGVFWLPFFPRAMRFHFNAHNLIVYGKEDNEYLISDPCFSQPVRCPARALQKARFAKGVLAPRGRMYFVKSIPGNRDLAHAAARGLRKMQFNMLSFSPPFCGVKGIGYLARRMKKWPQKHNSEMIRLNIAQIIRMLEEIGTGGAGFRYLYAAFLQEAATLIPHAAHLNEASQQMVELGDRWREFALAGSRICRQDENAPVDLQPLLDILHDCEQLERSVLQACRLGNRWRPSA